MKMTRRRATLVVAVLIVVPLLAWMWGSKPFQLRYRFFPKRLDTVYEGVLYRSGQISPSQLESTLRKLGIEVIVDLSGDRLDEAQLHERELVQRLAIDYRSFSLGGSGTGPVDQYVGAVEAITRAVEQGKPVLVHCRAGDRRTGGVIAAYQLLVLGEPDERAGAELRRHSRKPLEESRLLAYLNRNLREIGEELSRRGIPVHERELPIALDGELTPVAATSDASG